MTNLSPIYYFQLPFSFVIGIEKYDKSSKIEYEFDINIGNNSIYYSGFIGKIYVDNKIGTIRYSKIQP